MDDNTHNKKVEAALLEWINSFPVKQPPIESLSSLNDGHMLWEVLGDIDPVYFQGGLPEGPSNSGKWVSRWQNLKQICNCLISYITEERKQTLPKGAAMGSLKMIATDAELGETLKAGLSSKKHIELGSYADYTMQLLKLVLLASINSPRSAYYIGRMPRFSTSTQTSLKIIIEEVMPEDVRQRHLHADRRQIQDLGNHEPGSDFERDPRRASHLVPDPELQLEERLGRTIREKKDLQKELGEIRTRLDRLHEDNHALQERLTKAEDQRRTDGTTANANHESLVKQLEAKIRSQENYIAEQEAKVSEYESSIEGMKKTIERLQVSSGKSQKLQDEIDELRIERDGLMKKANLAERYKKKLQATQDLQKQYEDLVEEFNEVRQQFSIADKDRQQVAGLLQANEEYKRILPKIEQDRHELQMMKKQLEFDNAALAQRWDDANEQHARDQESIATLTDKLGDYELSQASKSIESNGLASEIEKSTRIEAQLQVALALLNWTKLISGSRRAKVTKLETEYQQLKATNALEVSKNTALQGVLDNTIKSHEQIDRKNLEVYQEKLMLESFVATVEQGDPIQRYTVESTPEDRHAHDVTSTEVFKKMRDQVSKEQKRSAVLEAELSEMKTQLQNEIISRKRGSEVLSHTTVDEKATTPNTESSDQVLKELLQRLETATDGEPTAGNEESTKKLDEHISLLAGKIISSRERLAKRIEEQNLIINELQCLQRQDGQRQSSPESPTRANEEKVASQQRLIENLRREIKLMASAFHDLGGRLQMNSVVLQRRDEAPRSWLNKQRKLVDQPALAIGR